METQHYEMLYIIPLSATSEDNVQSSMDQVTKILKEAGAEITRDDDWGKIKMNYPIKQYNHGNYVLLEFDLSPEKLKQVDNEIKINPSVLRHLIVKKDPRLAAIEEKRKKEQALREMKETETDQASPSAKEELPAASTAKKETSGQSSEKQETSAKASLDELDKKLDEILDESVI